MSLGQSLATLKLDKKKDRHEQSYNDLNNERLICTRRLCALSLYWITKRNTPQRRIESTKITWQNFVQKKSSVWNWPETVELSSRPGWLANYWRGERRLTWLEIVQAIAKIPGQSPAKKTTHSLPPSHEGEVHLYSKIPPVEVKYRELGARSNTRANNNRHGGARVSGDIPTRITRGEISIECNTMSPKIFIRRRIRVAEMASCRLLHRPTPNKREIGVGKTASASGETLFDEVIGRSDRPGRLR